MGLIVLGWFLHWWNANIVMIDSNVWIRPWGLESDLGFLGAESWIKDAEMPAFFAPLMWAFFALSLLALAISLFVKDKQIGFGKLKLSLPQFLIIGVGIAFIIVVIIALVYMSIQMSDWYGMKLIGTVHMDLGEPFISNVICELLPGFWITCAVGPLLVVLGLLRNKITGKLA
jgi:hypothetical protein